MSPPAFYVKQKSCDFILAASAFCMIIYISNRPDKFFSSYPSINAAVAGKTNLPKDSTIKTYKPLREFSSSLKDEDGKMLKWKERKKLLKQQIKVIKKSDNTSGAEKTLLVLLSVIVALGLLSLIAALSCELSCSGSDGAAVLVGVGGTALVIFLLVLVIRRIYKKNGKKRKAADPASGS